jgi:hypothetical protein
VEAERKIWRGNEHIKIRHFDELESRMWSITSASGPSRARCSTASRYDIVTLPQIEAKTVERLTEAGYRSRAFRIWRRDATGISGLQGESSYQYAQRELDGDTR